MTPDPKKALLVRAVKAVCTKLEIWEEAVEGAEAEYPFCIFCNVVPYGEEKRNCPDCGFVICADCCLEHWGKSWCAPCLLHKLELVIRKEAVKFGVGI